MSVKEEKLSFEAAMKELEALVARLEAPDISLDESFALFQRGIELSKHCAGCLNDVEKRVRILVGSDGEGTEMPFSAEGS